MTFFSEKNNRLQKYSLQKLFLMQICFSKLIIIISVNIHIRITICAKAIIKITLHAKFFVFAKFYFKIIVCANLKFVSNLLLVPNLVPNISYVLYVTSNLSILFAKKI